MDLSAEKCLVMVLLTILSIILGLIPYFIIRYTKSSLSMNSNRYHLFLTILSCFGAGVLLSTALLHVLPEVREASSNISEIRNTFDDHFPVAEMLVLAGFCMIYLVEEVAHFIMVDGHRGHRHHHRQRNTIARHTSIAHGIPMVNSSTRRPSLTISMSDEGNIIVNVVARPSTQPDLPDIQSSTSSLQNNGQYEEECPDEKSTLTSSFRASVALLALSFHGVVEGIAIGLQTSTEIWVMFGAIGSHKFVISFCMGMELMSSEANMWTYVGSIVFFSVVSPVGIIIGSALVTKSVESTDTLGVIIVQGLVCGTLLYVVFFEILNRERERKSYSMPDSKAVGFAQFIAIVIGLVAMGCLSTMTHEDHSSETS